MSPRPRSEMADAPVPPPLLVYGLVALPAIDGRLLQQIAHRGLAGRGDLFLADRDHRVCGFGIHAAQTRAGDDHAVQRLRRITTVAGLLRRHWCADTCRQRQQQCGAEHARHRARGRAGGPGERQQRHRHARLLIRMADKRWATHTRTGGRQRRARWMADAHAAKLLASAVLQTCKQPATRTTTQGHAAARVVKKGVGSAPEAPMRSSFISWSQCACAHALRLVAFGDSACGKQHGSQMNQPALVLRCAAVVPAGHDAQDDGRYSRGDVSPATMCDDSRSKR